MGNKCCSLLIEIKSYHHPVYSSAEYADNQLSINLPEVI